MDFSGPCAIKLGPTSEVKMPFYIISGLIGLAVIVVSCELFTNSIEWAGIRFRLNRGAAGKILQAAGAAVPGAIVPIIAVIFVAGEKGQGISTAAVLGPPLLLSTLAFGIAGAAALVYGAADKRPADLKADEKNLSGDLLFFSAVFSAAMLFSFFPVLVKKALGFLFLAAYIYYLYGMRGNKDKVKVERNLYFSRKKYPEGRLVLLQAAVSVLGMAAGAGFFVSGMEHFAAAVSVPAFLLTLIISPAATEMPGILNGLIWIKRKQENSALSHISGTMVLQGTVVVFAGISVTDWILSPQARLSGAVTIASALAAALVLKINKKINAYMLLLGAVFYALYLVTALKWVK
jgi:cation:H+ antiporter